jgi:hypothetical protein
MLMPEELKSTRNEKSENLSAEAGRAAKPAPFFYEGILSPFPFREGGRGVRLSSTPLQSPLDKGEFEGVEFAIHRPPQ